MRLQDAFMAHRGNFIDKWEHYLGVYDSELAPYVSAGAPVSLLEIGVQNGGSLQLWRDYLPKGSRIVGVDINPDCAGLPGMDGIEIHVVDGTDRARLDEVLGDAMFDIVIDDGSHHSADIVKSYQAFFHRMRGGGKLFIEDLHASYWADYGGGFRTPGSAMEFLKGLVDGLNSDHFREVGPDARPELDHLKELGASVARMTFYDSLAVIEFLGVPRGAPYRRVQAGGAAPAFPVENLLPLAGGGRLSTVLVAPTAARYIDSVLLGRIDDLVAASRRPSAPKRPGLPARSAPRRQEAGPSRAPSTLRGRLRRLFGGSVS